MYALPEKSAHATPKRALACHLDEGHGLECGARVNTRRSRPILRWVTLVVIAISASPRQLDAAALETAATVRIRVVEPTALAAPAVVRLTGDPATGPVFTAEVTAPGQVAIVRQVPAGSYRLVVTLAAFKEAVLDVSITAGATHEFLVELRPVGSGTADSVIRIAQTAPAANARVWDRAAVETFPGDDPISSIVETTVAPVIVDRMSTGGLWIGEAALVGGQAGSWRQTSIALGALDVTDPVRLGTPLARPPWESVETLIVATAMLPASARGPGPLLTVVPRTAGSVWRGGGEVGVMPGAMQADGTTNGVPAIAQFDGHHDASVVAGGPVGSARLFLSGRRSASTRLERDDPLQLETGITSLLGSLTRPTGSQGTIRAVASFDRAGLPYQGRARFVGRDVSEHDTFGTAQLTWDRRLGDGSVWSVSGGFARGAIAPDLEDASPSTQPSIGVVERLRDGPVPALFEVLPGSRSRWTIGTDVAPALARLGWRHTVTAGGNVSRFDGGHAPCRASGRCRTGGRPAGEGMGVRVCRGRHALDVDRSHRVSRRPRDPHPSPACRVRHTRRRVPRRRARRVKHDLVVQADAASRDPLGGGARRSLRSVWRLRAVRASAAARLLRVRRSIGECRHGVSMGRSQRRPKLSG